MLRCEDNSLYTGITTNVNRRFSEHKDGKGKGAKYTKSHKPIRIEAVWETDTKITASRLEYRIKKCKRPKKEDIILGKADVETLLADYEEFYQVKRIEILP